MRVIEKIVAQCRNPGGNRPVCIAFLGDSVTQGSFELVRKSNGKIGGETDSKAVYHNQLREMIEFVFPGAPLHIINAGIGGETAAQGLGRLDRDVLLYKPDLCVVCFGLNDLGSGHSGLEKFRSALDVIFTRLLDSGTEVIFMSPNMVCTEYSATSEMAGFQEFANLLIDYQKNGVMDQFMDAAKALCAAKGVAYCDCYAIWRRLEQLGADTNALLSNGINHPVREMHALFAAELFRMIMGIR